MFKFLGSSNRKLNQDYVISAADKVPFSQKFGYGLGTTDDMWGHWLYPGMAYVVFNIYLGVPPAWIGSVMLVKLLFEAIWDSTFGWLSDNTRTRFGRRRPFLLVGGILAGLALPILFFTTPGHSPTYYVWFMVITLGVYVPIISAFNMPFQSLGAELTPDYHERTRVFSIKSAMQKVPEVAMFAAGAFASAGVWVGAKLADAPDRLIILFGQTKQWFIDVFSDLFTFRWSHLSEIFFPIFGWKAAAAGEQPVVTVGAQTYTIILGAIMIVVAVVMFLLTKER
ncbi:MAG: MFS transporter [Nibricoccus sp.]